MRYPDLTSADAGMELIYPTFDHYLSPFVSDFHATLALQHGALIVLMVITSSSTLRGLGT